MVAIGGLLSALGFCLNHNTKAAEATFVNSFTYLYLSLIFMPFGTVIIFVGFVLSWSAAFVAGRFSRLREASCPRELHQLYYTAASQPEGTLISGHSRSMEQYTGQDFSASGGLESTHLLTAHVDHYTTDFWHSTSTD